MRARILTTPLIGAALAAVLLTGCGGTAKVSKDQLQEQITNQLTAQVGQRPDSVTCPDGLDATVGATQRCTLSAGGQELGVNATVTSVDGSNVKFDIKVDEAPAG